MVAVPTETPVATPDEDPIVAALLLTDQVPPPTEADMASGEPTHKWSLVDKIEGGALTVTIKATIQLGPIV